MINFETYWWFILTPLPWFIFHYLPANKKTHQALRAPFVGRLDDNSIAGLNLIKDINEVYKVQAIHRTRILSASIRYVNSVSQSFANGADIVTMPPSVFEKMYNHVLTEKGLDIFDNDAKFIVR